MLTLGTTLLHKRFRMHVTISDVCQVFEVNHKRITIYKIGEAWCTKRYVETNYEVIEQ